MLLLKRAHHGLSHLNLAGPMLVLGMGFTDKAVGAEDLLHEWRRVRRKHSLKFRTELFLGFSELDGNVDQAFFLVRLKIGISILVNWFKQTGAIEFVYAFFKESLIEDIAVVNNH